MSEEMTFCFLDTTSMPETQEMGGRADCQSVVERDCSMSMSIHSLFVGLQLCPM